MALRLNTKILLGFAIALSALVATSIMAFVTIRQLRHYTSLVDHSYQVLQQTDDVRLAIRDAQTGMRGYLLVGDPYYLDLYERNALLMRRKAVALQRLVADGRLQHARADTLRQLIEDQEQELEQFKTYNPSPEAAQALLLGEQQPLRTFKGVVLRLRQYEERLLRVRNQRQQLFQQLAPLAIVVSAVLAIIIVLWLFRRISGELRDKERLRLELTRVNQETARRIRGIEHLARQVVQGDYKVKIVDSGQDRLGSLATLLNQMTQSLDEAFSTLEKRNHDLDQFAYVASHDLKAPLRGLSTIVRWIEDEQAADLSPALLTYLNQMKGRLGRLDDLINGLLAYARASRLEAPAEELNVAQLARDVADLVVPPDFALELAPDLPTFYTDRLGLQQVFTNLFSNAVKYHGPGGTGRLRVSCHDAGRHYEFRVQDNGPGIAPEHHQKIFLLFQTLRDRHTAESTGIGLSIVKRLIDDRKGSIHVESDLGQGATFIFTWPKEPPPLKS
ncbi:ATP-binding protein [Hymenobacter sp. BT559]|uniref:sensor histidine kinase n=1 Tax=Hymenobacter sp. BT559 TaxID=2795729 RepID=UPI0018ECAED3|nr:ATP-binding protein [Hymenobacter sp. BT559]MBJ6143670.1 CHASE3 domain-containing protein [Hymenobacter sp. BT559]